jgi:hypothetical protein
VLRCESSKQPRKEGGEGHETITVIFEWQGIRREARRKGEGGREGEGERRKRKRR